MLAQLRVSQRRALNGNCKHQDIALSLPLAYTLPFFNDNNYLKEKMLLTFSMTAS
jgi:hypothetical protein